MARNAKWIKECWAYHSQYISELDVAVDWGELDSEYNRCWCCGHDGRLQKCHIIPKSLGGKDAAENIIPLCALCHDEAPDVADKTVMIEWIKNQQNPLSGIGLGRYWHLNKLLCDFSKSRKKPVDWDAMEECISQAYSMVSFHCSQSNSGIRMKKSTREWVCQKAFDLYEQQKS